MKVHPVTRHRYCSRISTDFGLPEYRRSLKYIMQYTEWVSPIDFGFLYGGKRGPHTKHMGDRIRDLGYSVTVQCYRLQSMFVLLLLSTKFWYVGPLKETKAKVTFLLILHPLRKHQFLVFSPCKIHRSINHI